MAGNPEQPPGEIAPATTHPARVQLPERPQRRARRTHRSAGYLSNKDHGVWGLCQGTVEAIGTGQLAESDPSRPSFSTENVIVGEDDPEVRLR